MVRTAGDGPFSGPGVVKRCNEKGFRPCEERRNDGKKPFLILCEGEVLMRKYSDMGRK
jgi:hypothetical protein